MMNTIEIKPSVSEPVLVIWEKFTLKPSDSDSDFFESGGDSLSAINMIVEIQKLFPVEISLEGFMRNPTLEFLLNAVQNNK